MVDSLVASTLPLWALACGLVLGCGTGAPAPSPHASPPVVADASTTSGDAGAAPPLRVATYNVNRFFDTVCDTGNCTATSYEFQATPAQFAAQADAIVLGIQQLGPDVIMLQEVETQTCLDALTQRLGSAWQTAVLGETGGAASVDVAVLSTAPLLEVRTHRKEPLVRADGTTTEFARELLEVHVQWYGRRVIALAAHFRSMVNDDPERRLLEARATRAVIEQCAREFPDALVVLGGDLNAGPGSPAIDALESDGGLFRPDSELAPDAAVTWGSGASAASFDHLYVPPASKSRYVPGTVEVLRTPGYMGLGKSDHAGLRARFALQ